MRPRRVAEGGSEEQQERIRQLEHENDNLLKEIAVLAETQRAMAAAPQASDELAALKDRVRMLEKALKASSEENAELRVQLDQATGANRKSTITDPAEQLNLLKDLLTEAISGEAFLERLDDVPNEVKKNWIMVMSLQLRTLGKLVSLSDAINQNLNKMETEMGKITAEACTVLAAERATVFAVDYKHNELYSLITSGSGAPLVIRIPDNVGIAGHVFQTNELTNIPDAYEDPRFNQEVDRKSGLRTKAILCAPIWAHAGLKIGLLQVMNKIGGGTFTEEDENFIQILALKVGIHLYHASVFEDAVNFMKRTPVLHEIMTVFLSEIHLGLEMDVIVEEICEKLDAERASVFLADFSTGELFSTSARNTKFEIRIPWDTGIAGLCFSMGQTINIPDAYKDSRFNTAVDKKTGYKTTQILAMPIRSSSGAVIGVVQAINLAADPLGHFDDESEFYLKRIAMQASFSLQYAFFFAHALKK